MGLFNNKEKDEVFTTDDRLIVLNHEMNVCEIHENVVIESEKVMAPGQIVVPIADCKTFVGTYGRVFVANCDDLRYIENAKRLAELEISTTLKHLVEFKPEKKPNPNTDMRMWLMGIALLIAIIL